MKHFMPALRMLIFMTLVTGVVYPLIVTGISQGLFAQKAAGGMIEKGPSTVGAHLIAQKFTQSKYFWGRPSAVDDNPLPSGGSNLGQASADLKKVYDERKQQLRAAHPDMTMDPPQDLLFASGSGLDPEISPEASRYQVQRVAKARSMDASLVQKIVDEMTQGPDLGILGEPRVNVLELNLALDKSQGL